MSRLLDNARFGALAAHQHELGPIQSDLLKKFWKIFVSMGEEAIWKQFEKMKGRMKLKVKVWVFKKTIDLSPIYRKFLEDLLQGLDAEEAEIEA